MKPIYHEGELAVQTRAGVREMSARIGKSIHASIPLAAQEFLSSQPMVVIASVDQNRRVWASILTGDPGFMRTLNERTVQINALPLRDDPLMKNLKTKSEIGMIVIEFATRRRMRINGIGEIGDDSKIYIHTEQVYANCPKYIQARTWQIVAGNSPSNIGVQHSAELSESQKILIQNADTFFIASHHRDGGADASHRGGNPGFIRVKNSKTFIFPDYSGNTMFQTLGNLTADPGCGLLFIDFESGSTLQLTGKVEIIWDLNRLQEFPGAERIVEFKMIEAIESSHAINLRWEFKSYSPFNPEETP